MNKLQVVETNGLSEIVEIDEQELAKSYVDLKSATQELNFKFDMYTRRLLLEGKLIGVKIQRKGFSKWYVERASIEAYASKARSGMRRYILRIDSENEEQVREALSKLKIEYQLELNYKGKSNSEQ